jgi:23S rRNA pseudouridine955/2504/2580 synthase
MLTVDESEANQKLLQYLQRKLPGVPRSALLRCVRKGQVRVDGKRCKPFQRIEAGQAVRIPPPMLREAAGREEAPEAGLEVKVVHETEDVLVIAKPAGLPAHGGKGHDDSAVRRVRAMRPGPFAPTPVHRLDKSTSGLLAFAKSYDGLRRLQEAFQSGKAGKWYLAWIAGAWPHGGRVELLDYLDQRGAEGRERVHVVSRQAEGARKAVSLASLIQQSEAASLVEVELLTGRKHQIRAQFASRGHPLLGDGKYGGPACRQGLLLHAWRLALPGEPELRLPPPWRGKYAPPDELLSD